MIVSGIEIDIVKKDIKNMHLSVLPPDGKVRVSVPKDISDDAIQLFVISKISWIKRQIDDFNSQLRQTNREYVSGESHYIWGQRYRMEVRHTQGNSKIDIKGNKFIFIVRPESTIKQRENTMNEWYRKQLKSKMPDLFSKWEEIIGVHAEEVYVKNMLTKWGTCNVDAKRIWINLQLTKKPPQCLEYVIVHELVHLLEKSHNVRFTQYMDQFLPDWKERKHELNQFIMDCYCNLPTDSL